MLFKGHRGGLWLASTGLVYLILWRTISKSWRFVRGTDNQEKAVSWCWGAKLDGGAKVILKPQADDPEKSGGKVIELPTEG
jgi:hypothetical protein